MIAEVPIMNCGSMISVSAFLFGVTIGLMIKFLVEIHIKLIYASVILDPAFSQGGP